MTHQQLVNSEPFLAKNLIIAQVLELMKEDMEIQIKKDHHQAFILELGQQMEKENRQKTNKMIQSIEKDYAKQNSFQG